jgi:hypothetical protein
MSFLDTVALHSREEDPQLQFADVFGSAVQTGVRSTSSMLAYYGAITLSRCTGTTRGKYHRYLYPINQVRLVEGLSECRVNNYIEKVKTALTHEKMLVHGVADLLTTSTE